MRLRATNTGWGASVISVVLVAHHSKNHARRYSTTTAVPLTLTISMLPLPPTVS